MSPRALWLSFVLLLFGCGQNITPKNENEPCTRSGQCNTGLVCLGGVCRPAEEANEAVDGRPDAGQ